MKILAFDTSLGALSAAVRWRSADGVWLLREAHEVRERGHAERLMPVISKLMGEAGLPFCELDRIAVTIGPGSFTGTRIGLAVCGNGILALAALA